MTSSGTAAVFQKALNLHRQGRFEEAEALYRAVLTEAPGHFDALHLLGVIQHQQGRLAEALELIGRAIAINPNIAAAHSNRGLVLQSLGQFSEALAGFDRALALKPDFAEAHYNRGNVLRDLKRPGEALASYERAVQLRPDYAEAWNNRANALSDLGRQEEALAGFDAALRLRPDYAEVFYNRGNALRALNRAEDALSDYGRALQLKPDFTPAHMNRANALRDLKRWEEALTSYERTLELRPDYADAWNNRGTTLLDLKRPGEALASFDRALASNPGFAAAYMNRGNALRHLNRYQEALDSYGQALRIDPDYAEAWNNRGTALLDLKRPAEALDDIERALRLRPMFAETLNNRGNALFDLKRYAEAAESFARALAALPNLETALGSLFHAKLHACDWSEFDATRLRILSGIERNDRTDVPFAFLVHSNNPDAQLRCARLYAADKCEAAPQALWSGQRYRHDRIRIAYLSADFNDHATAHLTAELFETHDRSRFEISAFSFGANGAGEMHGRLRRAFDDFHDIRGMSDHEAARMLREKEIDIAVDLKGFTTDSRPGILAHRPAPLQVSYLGFPGTMGTDFIDYHIADPRIVPPQDERFYSEKIVRLPDTYQVNDRKRRIADRIPPRTELGLPESGLVFCCFNNNYKITPHIFAIWMRLLKQVEGSVLWLLGDNDDAVRNLETEAERHGVNAARIVFAPRMDLPEHLARHRRADLFLDTYPCNAHTTASDALWAGLPLVTVSGETFASRVAGSLLHAAGLPELVTHDLGAYEALVLKLATAPGLLADIKSRLARNRDTCPLFDTDRFRRHIEAAYIAMHERHLRGEPPASFDVPPLES